MSSRPTALHSTSALANGSVRYIKAKGTSLVDSASRSRAAVSTAGTLVATAVFFAIERSARNLRLATTRVVVSVQTTSVPPTVPASQKTGE